MSNVKHQVTEENGAGVGFQQTKFISAFFKKKLNLIHFSLLDFLLFRLVNKKAASQENQFQFESYVDI